MLTFDGVWHVEEVFTLWMNPGLHCSGQMADSECGWAVCWCQHCGSSGPWCRWGYGTGRCVYGQWTQVHFIDGILNAQKYCDVTLWPVVVQFIHDHHLMLQHDNERPQVARICTQSLEAENIPVLAWPAYSPDMSPIEHVWDALDSTCIWYVYDSVFQFLPISSNLAQPLKRSGPRTLRSAATIIYDLPGIIFRQTRHHPHTQHSRCATSSDLRNQVRAAAVNPSLIFTELILWLICSPVHNELQYYTALLNALECSIHLNGPSQCSAVNNFHIKDRC